MRPASGPIQENEMDDRMTYHIPLPTKEELLTKFRYDPITGIFINVNKKKPKDIGARGKGKYGRVHFQGKTYIKSRIIWRIMTGEDPGILEIDHKDRDSSNNVWDNLRLATESQNKANRIMPIPSSGFKGVRKNRRGTYTAFIQINHKLMRLGTRSTPKEAHALFLQAEEKYRGEFALCS